MLRTIPILVLMSLRALSADGPIREALGAPPLASLSRAMATAW